MKYKKILLLLLLSLFTFLQLKAQVWHGVLKGIDKVIIAVELLGEEEIKMGLTMSRLQTLTELKIRREGIKVTNLKELSDKEMLENVNVISKFPFIYVNVNVVGKAFSINLQVNESVVLCRDKNILCSATTWQRVGTGTHEDRPEFIISTLSELLDIFLNDYYKANPKKK